MTTPEDAPRPTEASLDPGSFRDPGGRVFHVDGEVYRALSKRALADYEKLEATRFFPAAMKAGRIVATEQSGTVPAPPGEWAAVLHHERIPFVSYPYEWTFSMLRDAALLQLDLLAAALEEDMILKDSTPYNVQFRGSRPVFIDIGSFEPLAKGDVWVGYRQFLRLYLYPLMLRAYRDLPFQPWLKGDTEGLTAEQLERMLSARDLARKGVPMHVKLQARGERRYRSSERDVRSELKEAGFDKRLIQSNVSGLRKTVESLTWHADASQWNRYAADCGHVAVQRSMKSDFLAAEVDAHPPKLVWDVGANDGHFSRIAASAGGTVIAMDADELVLDELYRALSAEGSTNVLPLLQDLASPSPGLGWRGRERSTVEERGTPDLAILNAVVHHLVIGRNIPLGEVISWLADLGSRVVFEFVPPGDPMVDALTANKRPHEIHADYTEDALRAYLADRFVIEREEPVPGGNRTLFALRPGD